MRVAIEVRAPDGWVKVGAVSEIEPPGSISDESSGTREVHLFGWYEGDGPAVWRSVGGADVENAVVRVVASVRLEKLADLDGGPFELPYRGKAVRFRVES